MDFCALQDSKVPVKRFSIIRSSALQGIADAGNLPHTFRLLLAPDVAAAVLNGQSRNNENSNTMELQAPSALDMYEWMAAIQVRPLPGPCQGAQVQSAQTAVV